VASSLASAYAARRTLEISLHCLGLAAIGRLTVEKVDQILAGWGRDIVERAQIDLQVRGLEHVPTGRAYVVMSNHQSHMDIPLLYVAWPRTLRMVAKAELFRVPVWGRAMRTAGFVSVDRSGDRQNALDAMRACGDAIARGISIWIAPEGTRSPDGKLGKFKKGGFRLAIDAGVPIVPVCIDGSREVLGKHSKAIELGRRVTITFGPPIPVEGRKPDQLMAAVEAHFKTYLMV
jgi:1-acyl-sn-glycerol-3-phosphate acyltransferase